MDEKMGDKILVVEDNVYLRELLSYELEAESYTVTLAADGYAGLEAAQNQQTPDLIVLDVQLPGLNGFEICQILQQDPVTASIPIIFLTARTTLEDKLTGFDAGAADYLPKPFTLVELKARIKAALQRSRIERQRAELQLNQYKQHLSQNISHELLTPMTKILGPLEIILEQGKRHQLTNWLNLLDMARSGAHELRWLLEGVLMLNTIDEHGLTIFRKPTDFHLLIEESIQNLELRYQDKNLRFKIDLSNIQQVNMLKKHCNIVVNHLLDNACKFSPPDSSIYLFARAIGQGGLKMWVRDEGPGIEEQFQEKIFDKFYQIDMSVSRPQDGAGIGLYLARHITRRYGGEVTVESEVGKGTIFHLLLPDEPSDWQSL